MRGILYHYFPPQENALNGDHLWMETSCSGELCYLGEDACLLKTAVSTHTHTHTNYSCVSVKELSVVFCGDLISIMKNDTKVLYGF